LSSPTALGRVLLTYSTIGTSPSVFVPPAATHIAAMHIAAAGSAMQVVSPRIEILDSHTSHSEDAIVTYIFEHLREFLVAAFRVCTLASWCCLTGSRDSCHPQHFPLVANFALPQECFGSERALHDIGFDFSTAFLTANIPQQVRLLIVLLRSCSSRIGPKPLRGR
jgi:hypothetical protein